MLTDPHPSQQHAGLHHAVWRPQQEVTRPKTVPTSPEKPGVDEGANQVPIYLSQLLHLYSYRNICATFLCSHSVQTLHEACVNPFLSVKVQILPYFTWQIKLFRTITKPSVWSDSQLIFLFESRHTSFSRRGILRFSTQPWSSLVEGDEGSFWPKW